MTSIAHTGQVTLVAVPSAYHRRLGAAAATATTPSTVTGGFFAQSTKRIQMNKIELIEWKDFYDFENDRWVTLDDIETCSTPDICDDDAHKEEDGG